MKRPTRTASLLLPLSLAALPLCAAIPIQWMVNTSRAEHHAIEQFSGTSIDLEATLMSSEGPLAVEGEPRLYWQTNGMGSAWWSAPATASNNVLRAAWTPACETGGATFYKGFIGIPGSIYSAAFTLRLRPSPGAVPNALPLPAPRIDFAAVEVANAPWVEDESDPTVPAWAKAAAKPTYTASEVGAYTKAEADSKIAAATPADYAAVSNLAKSAVQPETLERYAKTEDLKSYVKSDLGVNALQAVGGTLAPEGLQLYKGWNRLIGKDTSTGVSLSLPKYVESNPWGFATTAEVTVALAPYAKKTELPTVPAKVSALENDAGYLTRESDPTVPAWAKAAAKPAYTASEVGAVPTTRKVNGKALSADVTLGAADVGAYTKAQTDSALAAKADAATVNSALALKADKSALSGYATTAALAAKVSSADPTFSNAVLAVCLNIDTNSVAVLNEVASAFGGLPIEGTATTVGGLLAALAAAVAWLKRNKADKADVDAVAAKVVNANQRLEEVA